MRALALSLLVVLVSTALTFALVGMPFYHFNDDAVMSTIVSGVGWIGGEVHPSPRAVFIHVLLGRALVALYAGAPALPWYGLMLLSAVALASLLLVFAGLRLATGPLSAAAVALHGALVTFSGIAALHFGIAASLLAGGAVALAASLSLRPAATARRTRALAALAFLAALFAALLRPENVWLGIASVAPLGLLVVQRRGWRAVRPLLAGLVALAAVQVLLIVYERHDYAAAPGWADTYEWMEAWRDLADRSSVVYDEKSRAAFAAAGWSANDYDQLRGWFVWDPERYSAPSLRRLYAVLRSHGAVAHVSLGQGRLRRALVTPWSLAALVLALLWGWAGSRRDRAALTLAVLWSLALLLAVAVTFKAPPVRVHLPIWLLTVGVTVLWAAAGGVPDARVAGASGRRRAASLLGVCVLLVAGLVHGAEARALASSREQRSAAARRDLARLAGYRGGLLINWAGLFPVHDLLRPLEPFRDRAGRLGAFGQHSFFWLGWPTRLPINTVWLERHGVRDLYQALYERDDLLLLAQAEYLPFVERDLCEHRGIAVGHERVLPGETVSVFRLVRLIQSGPACGH
jgi:hypothetical protein